MKKLFVSLLIFIFGCGTLFIVSCSAQQTNQQAEDSLFALEKLISQKTDELIRDIPVKVLLNVDVLMDEGQNDFNKTTDVASVEFVPDEQKIHIQSSKKAIFNGEPKMDIDYECTYDVLTGEYEMNDPSISVDYAKAIVELVGIDTSHKGFLSSSKFLQGLNRKQLMIDERDLFAEQDVTMDWSKTNIFDGVEKKTYHKAYNKVRVKKKKGDKAYQIQYDVFGVDKPKYKDIRITTTLGKFGLPIKTAFSYKSPVMTSAGENSVRVSGTYNVILPKQPHKKNERKAK